MTDIYLEFVAQTDAREMAYTVLSVYGIGTVLLGFLLMHLQERYSGNERLAAFLRICFMVYAGGALLVILAGLVILPLVKLD